MFDGPFYAWVRVNGYRSHSMTPTQTMHYFLGIALKFTIDLHCLFQPKLGKKKIPGNVCEKFVEIHMKFLHENYE